MSNLSETKDDKWLVSNPSLRPLNYYKILNELFNENKELKKLLKECREYIQDIQGQIEEDEYTMARNTAKLVKAKINQALGEDK